MTVSLHAPVNVRDLAGLPVRSGGSTQPGMLLRSDALYEGDTAPTNVEWPPTTVIDLRDATEASRFAWTWEPGVELVGNPLFSGARIDRVMHSSLSELYGEMLATSSARIVAALNHVDPVGSTLVHCAAGKDRTGVVIAVALLLADVEREAIIADYQRTAEAVPGIYERMKARKRLPRGVTRDAPVWGTPREAIELVLGAVSENPGGAWGWVEANGGDMERLSKWVTRFAGAPS